MFPRLEKPPGAVRSLNMRTPGEVVMKRWQVVLVIAFGFALVSRGVATPQSAALAPTALSAEAIGEAVASENPLLSSAERRRIGRAVLRSSADNELDPQLVTAIILVESGARPWVLSPKGAVGLMQVMPHMTEARMLAGNLTTIESNVAAGCSILADNIRRLGEDDGISAYFWGSDIRGVAYLDRVRAARATVRRLVES
jgi:soluble lytic murein transglycosylase-like protein